MNKIVVGRHASCAVRIDNPRVSARHAALMRDADGRVWIADLGSTNGTFVAGIVVTAQTELRPGMLVYVADVALDWEAAVRQHMPIEAPPIIADTPQEKNERIVGFVTKPWVVLLVLVVGVLSAWLALSPRGEVAVEDQETSAQDSVADSSLIGVTDSTPVLAEADRSEPVRVQPSEVPERSLPKWPPLYDPIRYSYTCLAEDDGFDGLVLLGGDIQNAVVEIAGPEISMGDEVRIGEEVRDDILKEYSLWYDELANARCRQIFEALVSSIDSPRGMRYELFMIDSDEQNAFTIGGKVFVYRGIYEFAASDDELAAVLAHEIQHNERGHLNRKLKKHALAENLFGDAAMIPLLADQVLLASFGQKDEAECDLHGVSHIVSLGYDGCAAANFWSRFAENEDKNSIDKLLRTHPYSSDRKKCIVAHINTNYGHACQE